MKKNITEEITCPFCPLLCDDVSITHDNKKFKVNNLKNKECIKKFESFNINSKSVLVPKIKNKISSFNDAILNSKLLIKQANEIGILNRGADVASIRSAINLCSQINANFDHANSKYFFDNMNIVQRSGFIATTLMEVKNRADTILVFGNNVFNKAPRLIEKILSPKSSLYTRRKARKIFLIGEFSQKNINDLKKHLQVTYMKIKLNKIPQFLESINSNKNNYKMNVSKKILTALKLSLRKSKYITAIYSSSDFYTTGISGSIVNSITQFICDLNTTIRAACLPIAGNLGDASNNQVATWLTGFPVRFKGVNGIFKHDREAYDVTKLIENNEIDLAIHFNSLSLDKIKLNKKIKNIVIGHPQTSCTSPPDVFIPIGIPGIDSSGIMFRTDNVVSMPLKSFRNLKIPLLNQVIDKMV